MKQPDRLRYFFAPPPLWVIQIGRDKLIFSRIKKGLIDEQEQLYLESNTLLLNKIANSSSLCHGLRLFCEQKKLSRIRAWFLLPKEFYPLPLLAHELFQFLISIKNAPVIPEVVKTNPFDVPTQLNANALQAISQAEDHLHLFNRYNKMHPGWLFGSILIVSLGIGWITTWVSTDSSQRIIQPPPIPKIGSTPVALYKRRPSPQKQSWPTIEDSLTVLLDIAQNIPQSIVLEKISTKQPTTNVKNTKTTPITTIAGITYNLHDLLEFVTTLEQKVNRHCNLSYIKEQSLPKSFLKSEGQPFALYRFSLTIDT